MTWLYLIILIFLLTASYAGLTAAPWLPTKKRDVPRLIAMAEIKPGDKVYDLGCGEGRLVFAAVAKGATAVGIEVSLLPYLVAKIRSFAEPRSKIIFGDFFHKNISSADIVYVFLMEKSYERLKRKFLKELRPGTRVIFHCWKVKGWEDKLIKSDKPEKELGIYVYQI